MGKGRKKTTGTKNRGMVGKKGNGKQKRRQCRNDFGKLFKLGFVTYGKAFKIDATVFTPVFFFFYACVEKNAEKEYIW